MLSLIRQRLREGVATQSPFDRRSRALYAIMALELLAGAAASVALGFVYRLDLLQVSLGVTLIAAAWALRRIDHGHIAGGIETTVLALVQGFPAIFLIFPLLVISGPYADPWLTRADELLGFNWLEFMGFFDSRTRVLDGLVIAYRSLFVQPFIIVPALWLAQRSDRAWSFVTALSISLLMVLLIYPFAPADGTFIHFGVSRSEFPLSTAIPWTFGPVVHAIKDGERIVTSASLKGLVTFPSYHAAVSVALIWAAWPMRWLRVPTLALNVVMLVSCLIVGAHYLVDVIAGSAIAAISIILAASAVGSQLRPTTPYVRNRRR